MCPKIINVITNGSQNPVTKRPHFAEQPLGHHHKCGQKSCDKTPHFAEKPARHHKRVKKIL
jgi:hypothetical protein